MILSISTIYAATQKCQDVLSEKDKEIKNSLHKNGYTLIEDCSNIEPYLYIALVDLDDSTNKISITHAQKTSDKYRLRTITEHAKSVNAIIAINGFIWVGDPGTKDGIQYAKRPSGTVYSEREKLYKRTNNAEVVIGFSKRDLNCPHFAAQSAMLPAL